MNVLVIEGERRLVGGFTNIQLQGGKTRVKREFTYEMHELTEPQVFGNGSGAPRVIADGHAARLLDQLGKRARTPRYDMKLLASVNRRIAKKEKGVSPHCHVSFLGADPNDSRFGSTSHVFVEDGESVPFRMPVLLFGADLSFAIEQFMQAIESGQIEGYSLDPDEANKNLKRRD